MFQRLRHIIAVAALMGSLTAMAYSISYYTPSSELADGRWVKVDVDTSGIYQINYEQLKQLGFSNPEDVKVYGYGGAAPTSSAFSSSYLDDVPLTASMHTADGRLLFYAEGPLRATMNDNENLTLTRNTYDSYGHYFLSDKGGSGYKLIKRDYIACPDEDTAERNWHYSFDIIEREVQNPGKGGAYFHGPQLTAGQSEDFTFHIRDFGWNRVSRARGVIRYHAAFNTPVPTTPGLSVSGPVEVSADDLRPSLSGSNTVATRLYSLSTGCAYFYPAAVAGNGYSAVAATFTLPADYAGSYAAVDAAYVIYPRLSVLGSQPELSMYFRDRDTNKQSFTIAGADADVQVWNVTDPTNIFAYTTVSAGTAGTVMGTMGDEFAYGYQRLVAFNPSAAHRSVTAAYPIANSNLHATETPDMLIVTTVSLLPQAQELADIHRSYGKDVVVCTQEDAFNEFGSGARHPAAVRRLVKMYYDRDRGRLRSVLMYGAATYDYRGVELPAGDPLVTFECENIEQARDGATNYATDVYFGIVNDNFNAGRIHNQPSQISVGRLPVAEAFAARQANSKVKAYYDNQPGASVAMRVLKISDDGDGGSHFANSEEVANALLANPDMTVIRADNLLYPLNAGVATDAIKVIDNTLKRGVGLFYYTGHGDSHSLSGEGLWSSMRAKTLSYPYQPVAMLASCDSYPFDREHGSLAEVMTAQPNGGMIGVIGACRSVYLDHNHPFSLAIANAYATAEAGSSGADLLKNARNAMIERGISGNLGYNTLCYNYCGDPAIPLSMPTYNIVVDRFGDGDIQSGVATPIEAKVVNANGTAVTAFNGRGLIEVYDAPLDRTTRAANSNDGKATTVSCDENLLAEYPVKIVDGVVSTAVSLPRPAISGSSYRLTITARDASTGLDAAGNYRGDNLVAGEDGDTDTDSPVIVDFAVDPQSLTGDNLTGTAVVLNATILPPAGGLAVGSSGIRSGIALTIDGKGRYPEVRNMLSYNEDGTASLSFALPAQTFGPHTATLTVAGNNGTIAEAVTAFTVATDHLTAALSVDDELPVRRNVTFSLDSSVSVPRFIIIDSRGNTVYSDTDVSFPYRWDLRGNDGRQVPDGHYRAWTFLESDLARGASNIVEFIVVK